MLCKPQCLIMSNQSMNVSKFTIMCALFQPIVYINVLTTGGFCTDSLKATTTPQIHHLICKGRKSKCSVQTVHSFEYFLVILYKTTSEHEINTSQFDDNWSIQPLIVNNSLYLIQRPAHQSSCGKFCKQDGIVANGHNLANVRFQLMFSLLLPLSLLKLPINIYFIELINLKLKQ